MLKCAACNYKASVIAGTIFQDAHLPLTTWFRAMWWVISQKNGASAINLQRILNLGSYKTAWTLLHKLRRAMVRPGRDRLSGIIEVDETYIGGSEKRVRGRKIETKSLVVIAAQEDGKKIGRIRMKRVKDASAESLQPFVQEYIEPGSTVNTDGWEGYVHKVTVFKGSKKSASDLLPRIHLVASLVKRWLMVTHQGAVSQEHLEYYLNEFTFRFNRRTSRSRGKLFYRLIQQSLLIEPKKYNHIVTKSDKQN